MGTYCLDWWERILVNMFVLMVVSLVLYGLYKQLAVLITLYRWWSKNVLVSDGRVYPT